MQFVQEITLDLETHASFGANVFAKEDDNLSRFLKITLTKGGLKVVPGEDDEALFRCIKPDGHSVLNPATINDDGTITAELTGQVLAVPGKVDADITIVNGQQILSTFTFVIQNQKKPFNGDEALSTNEFLYIIQKANEAEAWAHGKEGYPEMDEDNAKYWAEQAQEAADGMEAIKDAAIEARDDAIEAKDDAESARDTAISAKDDAVDAKDDAETARDAAIAAKDDAVTAQGSAEDAEASAEAWAHGSGDYPERDEDNAKYWAEQAQAVVTDTHGQLSGRDSADQHPMSAITGLTTALAEKLSSESDPTVPDWAKSESKPSYTKAEVGLGNVDNTSDLDKPISTATQSALDEKANETDLIDVYEMVTTLVGKIPSQATAQNQLADKAFVNSTVGTNTAIFRGTFDSVEDLEAYTGDKTNNDYAFVIIYDETITTQVNAYDRYKYNGTSWVFEYELNNSSFTANQWAAINSEITSAKVGDYDDHIADEDIHVTAAQKTSWDGKYSKPSTGIPDTDLAQAVKTILTNANAAIGNGGLIYTTTAPTSANTGNGLKIAYLTSEPETKYAGWLYLIAE